MGSLSRRRLLYGLSAAGLAAGCAAHPAESAAQPPIVDPHGPQQAGVTRPAVCQTYCELSIWDIPVSTRADAVLATLTGLATTLADGTHPALAGCAPANVTVTVGLGPDVVHGIDPLPEFPGDRIPAANIGGDLLVQVCGDDPLVVSMATGAIATSIDCTLRWQQNGFRGSSTTDGVTRNLLGFVDGIEIPHGPAQLAANVWTADNATIAVIRRMRLDVAGFLAQPVAAQEAVFGRRKDTAAPLSGGGPNAGIALGAKRPDGDYLVPVDAHVRKASPATAGVSLMLRRSFNYDNGLADRGLIFVSFQRELRTFVNTAYQMATGDALLRYATTTASGAFLILPGCRRGQVLTADLRR